MLRRSLRTLFSSEMEPSSDRRWPEWRQWDRWDKAALAFGLLLGGLCFAYQMWQFWSFAYTSDLFITGQLASSVLDGHPFRDNCFGNHLIFHTYFFTPVLGVLVKPLGIPGLFVAEWIAIAWSCSLAARIVRYLGATGPESLGLASVLLVAPPAVANFFEPGGMHVEQMVPLLALGLFAALLRRRPRATVVWTLLVCSVKEDAPLGVMCIAAVVLVEEWVARRRIHRLALLSFGLAAVALPLLLLVGQLQAPETYAVNRFTLLATTPDRQVHDIRSLVSFIGANFTRWVAFAWKQNWFRVFVMGTFGLVVLRPWAIVFLFGTTAVAFVLNQDLTWAPRFANTLGALWCVSLLGAASVFRASRLVTPRLRPVLRLAIVGLCAFGLNGQYAFVWWTKSVYTLQSAGQYTLAEREQANRLFAIYRQNSKRSEPVVASPFLFRFAHDRNLFWMDRLAGRPRPVWILGDGSWEYTDFGLKPADYVLVGKMGRFTLRRLK